MNSRGEKYVALSLVRMSVSVFRIEVFVYCFKVFDFRMVLEGLDDTLARDFDLGICPMLVSVH